MLVFPALADRTTIRPAWNLFTTQQDIEMGRALVDDAEQTLRIVDDHNPNTYIDALGKQLAAHTPGAKYPYQFKIVGDDAINAWALPGGIIYVTSGLIQAARNEPQLAGALAHEIAHVALRHGTAEVSQAYAKGVGNSTRGRVSVNDALTRLNIRFEQNAIPLKYSAEEERQAHLAATQILYDTGFDPRQMTQVFQTMNRSNGAEFFTAHPFLTNHAAIVRNELRNIGALPATFRGDSPDFQSVKNRLSAMNTNGWPAISDRNRNGVGGDRPELPSTRMVLYSGRDIEFRYPDNWRVSEGNDSISVGPDEGFVSGSLAYGIEIGTFDPRNSNSFRRDLFSTNPGAQANTTTLANATNQLVDHLRDSNPNMQVVRNTARTRVDGAQAMVVELTNDSPLGGTERNWLVTVLRPNGLLRYFIGAAPQSDFNQYQPAFERIIGTVQFLD
jgi:predicted outer membrane protein